MNDLVKAMEELHGAKREVTHECVTDLQWLRELCNERPALTDAQWDRLALLACELSDIYAKGFNAGQGLQRKRSNIVNPEPVVRANGVKPKRIPTGMTKEKAAKRVALDFNLGDLGL